MNRPGTSRGLLDIFRYRYLLGLLVRKSTITRYYGSILGWAWSYVKPTTQFLIYYLVLGVFLGLNRGVPSFPIYLFSGIVVINLFNEAFSNATKSVVDNSALVKKIYLPRELFPIATVCVAFIHFLPQLVVLAIVSLLFGWIPSLASLGLVVWALVIVLVLATGLGMVFGAIDVSFRDARNLVEIILMFATWASPVLYSWTMVRDKVSGWLFEVYMLNPLTSAVEFFHEAFWVHANTGSQALERPPLLWQNGMIALLIAVAMLVIGQLVFKKMEGRFAQDL